jgi:ParG protein
MAPKKSRIPNQAQEKVFQTTVRLPEPLHRAFKAKCATEGKKITDVLKELVSKYVGDS